MAGESAVDRAQMATAATQVDHAVSEIQALQLQVNGYHDELRGGWESIAATKFTDLFLHFNDDFTKIVNVLGDMHEKLVGTRSQYEATEESTTSAVGQVGGLLNR